MIAWSYSRLTTFERCPLMFRLKNITKDIPYIETPPLAEGKRKHNLLEEATRREMRLLKGEPCTPIYEDLIHMRSLIKGIVENYPTIKLEEELAFKRDWTPCSWFDKQTYFRCKMDLLGIDGRRGVIFDWKSGKVRVNEEQLRVYNMTALKNYPDLEQVASSLVFLDHQQFSKPLVTKRIELPGLVEEFEERAEAIQVAEKSGRWPYKDGYWCSWCDATPGMCPKKGA